MKPWVVIAAVGLTTAGGVVTPGAARASSSAWYQVYQTGGSGFFTQIAAVSKDNIWAVADTYTKGGKRIYRPFIRHFDGSSWQAITIPHSLGFTSDWVSASGAKNVWVGGVSKGPIDRTIAYRWNGARWRRVRLPRLTYLSEFVVLAPDNVWAYGTGGFVPYDIFHWNGSKWRHYLLDNTDFIPQSISASAPNNVWLSGFAYKGSKQEVAAYRWNGTALHRRRMPHPVFDNAGPDVTAVSPSNVWIGWFDNNGEHVLHWNGHRWQSISAASLAANNADPTDVVPDGKGGYWFGAQEILTGSTWTFELVPGFTGGFGGVTRIPGTTSFLLTAGVRTGSPSIEKPTIFRFDL